MNPVRIKPVRIYRPTMAPARRNARTHHRMTMLGLVHLTQQMQNAFTKMDTLGKGIMDVVKSLDDMKWEAQERRREAEHAIQNGCTVRSAGDFQH
jgi:hypothetical protein